MQYQLPVALIVLFKTVQAPQVAGISEDLKLGKSGFRAGKSSKILMIRGQTQLQILIADLFKNFLQFT